MSWEELEVKSDDEHAQKAKEAAIKTAKDFAHCFSTEQGKSVLQHLVNEFVMANDVEFNAQNIDYQAAYKNGEAGLVKYILKQLERAQLL